MSLTARLSRGIASLAGSLARFTLLHAAGLSTKGWRDWQLTLHPPGTDVIVCVCPPGDAGGEVRTLPKEAVVNAFALWRNAAKRVAEDKVAAARLAGQGALDDDGLPVQCDNPECRDCYPLTYIKPSTTRH